MRIGDAMRCKRHDISVKILTLIHSHLPCRLAGEYPWIQENFWKFFLLAIAIRVLSNFTAQNPNAQLSIRKTGYACFQTMKFPCCLDDEPVRSY